MAESSSNSVLQFSYYDTDGELRGPFSAKLMRYWYENGCFPMDLKICNNLLEKWCTLGELIHDRGAVNPFRSLDGEEELYAINRAERQHEELVQLIHRLSDQVHCLQDTVYALSLDNRDMQGKLYDIEQTMKNSDQSSGQNEVRIGSDEEKVGPVSNSASSGAVVKKPASVATKGAQKPKQVEDVPTNSLTSPHVPPLLNPCLNQQHAASVEVLKALDKVVNSARNKQGHAAMLKILSPLFETWECKKLQCSICKNSVNQPGSYLSHVFSKGHLNKVKSKGGICSFDAQFWTNLHSKSNIK